MSRRRGDAHRLMRWLWTSPRSDARLARLALLPAAGVWRAVTFARERAYRLGWLGSAELPLPTIGIGNLTVGASGRGAVTAWAAAHCVAAGSRPGVLLHAGDAAAGALSYAIPGAIVVDRANRLEGGRIAAAAGARILVLDDAFQQLDIARSLNIAVVGAETTRAVGWTLPAGPWRENRISAFGRADAVVITRRRATAEAAEALRDELEARVAGPVAIARIGLTRLRGLVSGMEQAAEFLERKRVVAATGLPDPDAFVSQVKATGAAVQLATWRDRAELRDADVAWLAHAARRADHVVITERDAVRLRDRWPANVPEPLVAMMDLAWEHNGGAMAARLDLFLASAGIVSD